MKNLFLITSILILSYGCSQDEPETFENNNEILKIVPFQCQDQPWEVWNMQNQTHLKLTEEELIKTYLFEEHEIKVLDYKRKTIERPVCQACNICPKGHIIKVEVNKNDAIKLQTLGWEKTNETYLNK